MAHVVSDNQIKSSKPLWLVGFASPSRKKQQFIQSVKTGGH